MPSAEVLFPSHGRFEGPYWVHDFTQPSPEGWSSPYPFSVSPNTMNADPACTTELFVATAFTMLVLIWGPG